MGSKLDWLIKKEALNKGSYPHWLQKQTHYETIMGSTAYGCSTDASDIDVYGFCMPPKNVLFPHLDNKIIGFDDLKKFEQWQQHHVKFENKEYDFTIFSIVRYFSLLMDNNPNIVDSIYTPADCLLHCTPLAAHVRTNRDLFLSKKGFHKFTGYLHSQLAKLDRAPVGKRKERVERDGFDRKYLYHSVRLACEIEQVLELGTLDLRRDSEIYKAIRRGDWTLEQGKKWLYEKELHLNKLYESSKLRNKPEKAAIKNLLMECFEMEFGSLTKMQMEIPDRDRLVLEEIDEVLERWRK